MSKHITVAEWELAGEFTKAAEPGDTVDEEIVDNFLNVMPPAAVSSDYLQMGETYDHVEDENGWWRPTFLTFQLRGGSWVYCGCCFRGETVDRRRQQMKT